MRFIKGSIILAMSGSMAVMGVLLYEAFDFAERRLTKWRIVA